MTDLDSFIETDTVHLFQRDAYTHRDELVIVAEYAAELWLNTYPAPDDYALLSQVIDDARDAGYEVDRIEARILLDEAMLKAQYRLDEETISRSIPYETEENSNG